MRVQHAMMSQIVDQPSRIHAAILGGPALLTASAPFTPHRAMSLCAGGRPAPPCALSHCKRHMCQSFVLKLMPTKDDLAWLRNDLMRAPPVIEGFHPSAFAVLQLFAGPVSDRGTYVVLATLHPRDFDSFAHKLTAAIARKVPGSRVEWVKRLTVRLQRLFGWGDAGRPPQPVPASPQASPQASPRTSPTGSFQWLQSAEHPAPFGVVDLQKISSSEKLGWMRQELGDSTSLRCFSLKFMELFGSKLRGKTPQKRAILELYAHYTGAPFPLKEKELPPGERAAFSLLWEQSEPKKQRIH